MDKVDWSRIDKSIPPGLLLQGIIRVVRELDGDLKAMGPEAATDVHGNIAEACRLLNDAWMDLRSRSGAYVQAQMDRLGIDASSRNLKVQLGGGPEAVAKGWLNVDLHPSELALNVRWGLPFPDGSVAFIYSSHMLEHLYSKFESIPLLQEIYRVLQPGGVVRIVVPHIGKCLEAYGRKDTAFFEDRKKIWPWASQCRTPLEHFLEYAGANQYDASFDGHKYGYDFETLRASLQQASFTHIAESDYMKSATPELNLDNLSATSGAASNGNHYSLYVEAVK